MPLGSAALSEMIKSPERIAQQLAHHEWIEHHLTRKLPQWETKANEHMPENSREVAPLRAQLSAQHSFGLFVVSQLIARL